MIPQKIFIILLAILFFSPLIASADDNSLALTITPPLTKINMEPGEAIATAIKVVNNNSYPVTIYARVLDFKDNGNGQIEFLNSGDLPSGAENDNIYLSRWITLSQDQAEIEPFRPATISFTIEVPPGAQPGGHYAAILIGTNPPAGAEKGTEIKVSSYVSSLLLVRISGAIEEKGMIREFTFSKRLYSGGEGDFRVSFENSGNVHLQPMGVIKIYDMFGKLKGDIPVNVFKDFGNVLPKSIRVWDNLKWAEEGFFLINRYKAELSLTYGEQAKQTDYQTFFFWGVNLKWLSIIGGSLLLLFVLIILFVRFYIRSSVKNLQKQMKAMERVVKKKVKEKEVKAEAPMVKPITEKKVIDLRKKK